MWLERENMTDIIDAVTGEVIEQEDRNEVVVRKLTEVGAIHSNTYNIFFQFRQWEQKEKMTRDVIKKALEQIGEKKMVLEDITFTVIPESSHAIFDTERAKNMKLSDFLSILIKMDKADLKRISVYDYFQKLSYTKSKLNVRFK